LPPESAATVLCENFAVYYLATVSPRTPEMYLEQSHNRILVKGVPYMHTFHHVLLTPVGPDFVKENNNKNSHKERL
jgi:hypothetical protein